MLDEPLDLTATAPSREVARPPSPRFDDEQVPEREFDALSLARSNQEPWVSGANRV